MPVITLSQDERTKFADWLEQDATSSKLLIEQLTSLGTPGEAVAGRMKTEMKAAIIILSKLRSIQEM